MQKCIEKITKQETKKKNAAKKKKCQNVVRGRGGLSYLVAKMSSGRHILAGQKWWLESRAEGEWQAQTAFRFRFFSQGLKGGTGGTRWGKMLHWGAHSLADFRWLFGC